MQTSDKLLHSVIIFFVLSAAFYLFAQESSAASEKCINMIIEDFEVRNRVGYATPNPGNSFYIYKIIVENKGYDEFPFDYTNFVLEADRVEYTWSPLSVDLNSIGLKPLESVTLLDGGKIWGYVGFEAPSDASYLKLVYAYYPIFSGGEYNINIFSAGSTKIDESDAASDSDLFPDRCLEAVIRTAIDKPKGEISIEDLESISGLHANSSYIKDITGLEYCHNLRELYLENNQITDISPLSGLTNLRVLYLSSNEISDVSPLSGLDKLTVLYLSFNQISDISPLSTLKNLKMLGLVGNQITDISPLSGLKNLRELSLSWNQITDVSPLSTLYKLQYLALWNNQITDISPLSKLYDLQYLYLWGNQITDVSPLSGLTNLKRLSLSNNRITDISPLSDLTDLQKLDLWGNPINDTSSLAGLNCEVVI